MSPKPSALKATKPYDFSRLTCLLVEDDKFMRSVLRIVVDALGIRNYYVAENGREAIEILKRRARVRIGGESGIDLVLMDIVLPDISGHMLVRWLRRDVDSPNRFAPVITISSMVDRSCLIEARDAGANEILAKPYSPEAVFRRILSVIESPRQFVYTPAYFGPDRRRSDRFTEDDRRRLAEKDCEIVYSGKNLGRFRDDKAPVWLFRLPNRLKQKLTGSQINIAPGEASTDEDVLAVAQRKIAEMADDYTTWVEQSIADLGDAYEEAHAALGADGKIVARAFERINMTAHELRGQGDVFGYPLISEFGASLYNCTAGKTPPNENLLEFIKAHIDGITAVTRGQIKGDGGETGKELKRNLTAVQKKYARAPVSEAGA